MSKHTGLINNLLKSIPSLDHNTALELSKAFSLSHYSRSESLLRQGEVWNQAYLLEAGLIRMHFTRPDGKEFNKNFFSEAALLFPLTVSMQTTPSLFGISCIEDCQVWCCDIQKFQAALPEETYLKLNNRFLMQLLDGKLQREHDLLSLSATQRYQKFINTQTALVKRIPLHQLATYLGVTDVSLSRLRKELKED